MAQEQDVQDRRSRLRERAAARGEYPKDRFDELPKQARVGAHRIVARPRRFALYLLSILLGVIVLTAAGIVAVQVIGADVSSFVSEEEQAPRPPQVKPELDPEAPVVVLNGTRMPGFGGIIDNIITQNNWGTILFSTEAASHDVEISAIFYASSADEAAALGLARELGGVSVYQSDDYTDFGAKLVVLLGADYAGPGSEQFVAAEIPADAADGGEAPADEGTVEE